MALFHTSHHTPRIQDQSSPWEGGATVASPSDTSLPPPHYPKTAWMCCHCLLSVRQECELVSSQHLKPSSILEPAFRVL